MNESRPGKPGAYRDRSRAPAPQSRRALKPHRGLRIAAGVMLILVAFMGVALILLRLYVRPPQSGVDGRLNDDLSQNVSPRPVASGETPVTDTPAPGVRDSVYTFLLAGQRDGNTDTLMVALLDLKEHTLNVVSIPRDTLVNVSRKTKKINAAYNAGGQKEKGVEQLKRELSTLLGFTPRNFACVDMKGFVRLVNALGGVDFDVPLRMYYPEEGINLYAGLQTLDGDKALQLVRYRGYGPSASKVGLDHDDYGRMRMQQQFLMAVAQKTLNIGNLFKIGEFVDIAGQNLLTNLDAGNLLWVGEQCLKLGAEDIHFYTLPTVSVKYEGDANTAATYYEIVQTEQALELINRAINPYTTPITADMVDHMVLQGGS